MLLVIDKSIAMNEGIVVDGGQALNDKRMLASLLIISPLTKKFHNIRTTTIRLDILKKRMENIVPSNK